MKMSNIIVYDFNLLSGPARFKEVKEISPHKLRTKIPVLFFVFRLHFHPQRFPESFGCFTQSDVRSGYH